MSLTDFRLILNALLDEPMILFRSSVFPVPFTEDIIVSHLCTLTFSSKTTDFDRREPPAIICSMRQLTQTHDMSRCEE